MTISDQPDIPIRAVHYDTKYFQDKKEYVKSFIRTLASYKINMLIWEWEDKFAYRSHPEIGAPGAKNIVEIIKNNIEERNQVFAEIETTWEKSQFTKGMSTPYKKKEYLSFWIFS